MPWDGGEGFFGVGSSGSLVGSGSGSGSGSRVVCMVDRFITLTGWSTLP